MALIESKTIRTIVYGLNVSSIESLNVIYNGELLIDFNYVNDYFFTKYYDWLYVELKMSDNSLSGLNNLFRIYNEHNSFNLYKQIKAINLEYEPLENYRGFEKSSDTYGSKNSTITNSGNDSIQMQNQSSGTDTIQNNYGEQLENSKNKIVPYNQSNSELSNESDNHKNGYIDNNTTTYGKKDVQTTTNTHGHIINTEDSEHTVIHELEKYGNLGVTTSQQMLESELELRKRNIYNEYLDRFIHEYCFYIN